MRRVMKKITFAAAAAALSVSLAACGGEKTVEEYLNQPDVQAELEELRPTLREQGLTLEAEADGDVLTYTYKCENELPEGAGETLEQGLDAQASTIEANLEDLKKLTSDEVRIQIIYVDRDGNELVSRVFE